MGRTRVLTFNPSNQSLLFDPRRTLVFIEDCPRQKLWETFQSAPLSQAVQNHRRELLNTSASYPLSVRIDLKMIYS